MNKESLDPLEYTLLGILGGAGFYGAHRGLRDIGSMLARKSENPQDLVIPIPASKLYPQQEEEKQRQLAATQAQPPVQAQPMTAMASVEKEAEGPTYPASGNLPFNIGAVQENFLDMAGAAGGSMLGYAGASQLYELIKRRRIEQDRDQMQKQYLHRLNGIANSNKFASCMDCFVAGVADKMTEQNIKQGEGLFEMIGNKIRQNAQPAAEGLGNALGKGFNAVYKGTVNAVRGDGSAGTTGDYMDKAVASALAVSALSGLGIYGLGTYAGKKQSPEDQNLPSNVLIRAV